MFEPLSGRGPQFGIRGFQGLGVGGQVGPEPVARLTA